MAVDTQAKRMSAIHISEPWRFMLVPSGTIGQGPRQAVAFMYSGILAAAPAVNSAARFLLLLGAGT